LKLQMNEASSGHCRAVADTMGYSRRFTKNAKSCAAM